MGSRAAAEDDRRIRRGIRDRAVELDELARIPAWTLDTTGPEPVLRDADGEPMATIHGPWTPNIARYLTAIGGDAGPAIVELLQRVAGGRSQDIRDAAEKVLAELGIEEAPVDDQAEIDRRDSEREEHLAAEAAQKEQLPIRFLAEVAERIGYEIQLADREKRTLSTFGIATALHEAGFLAVPEGT